MFVSLDEKLETPDERLTKAREIYVRVMSYVLSKIFDSATKSYI